MSTQNTPSSAMATTAMSGRATFVMSSAPTTRPMTGESTMKRATLASPAVTRAAGPAFARPAPARRCSAR